MRRTLLHDPVRRGLLAAGLGFGMAPQASAAAPPTGKASGAGGFDFLFGAWRVRHRRLRHRLTGSHDWIAFPGSLEVSSILGGLGDIDDNVLEDPDGSYTASTLRVFDAAKGEWSIFWMDARAPGLDPPLVGHFVGRVGRFHNDDVFAGRPIRVRFTYEDLGPGAARWDQAFSPDGGATWKTNWTMDFTRAADA